MQRAPKTSGLTAEALAEQLEIGLATIYRWAEAGCPHKTRGDRKVFDLAEVNAWHKARRGDAPMGKVGKPSAVDAAPSDLKERLAIEQLRKLTAQASRIELELEIKRGLYLPAAEVEQGRIARISAVKAKLLALPARLGSRCANRDAVTLEREADDEVRRALEEFAR